MSSSLKQSRILYMKANKRKTILDSKVDSLMAQLKQSSQYQQAILSESYADAAKMARLGGEREVLAQQLEQAEAAWMELLGD